MSVPTKTDSRLVQFHQPIGLSTLFRPLPKVKSRLRPSLDITYQASNGGPLLRFSAKAALGIPEQTLLLVLIEMAQQQYATLAQGALVSAGTESDIGRELWGRLFQFGSDVGEQTLMVNTTWYELNRRCGSQTGGAIQAMRVQQLERLCEVVVWEYAGDAKSSRRQSYLVVLLTGDDKRIYVALNCRLASAILGKPYSKVSLVERLALKSDIAKALHAFLSTAIRHGRNLEIGLECLVKRLWPESATPTPTSTHRARRSEVLNGLVNIGSLSGWAVDRVRGDIFKVTRKCSGVSDMTSYYAAKSSTYRRQPLPKIKKEINELHSFDASRLFFTKNTTT